MGLSLYFGLRKGGRLNVTYVPPSYKRIKFELPTYKKLNVLVLDSERPSFLDDDKLTSTSSDVPGLHGYKKILFTLPQKKHIDEAKVRYSKLEIVPGIFSRATIYTWFGEFMLLIINTTQVVADKEVNNFHYFTHDEISYNPYQIDSDIQDNLEEMKKLLKKINRDRKVLFSIDIDNGLGDPTLKSFWFDDVALKVIKSFNLYAPFIQAEIYTSPGLSREDFQIDKLTHNGTPLKINLPDLRLSRINIYFWNRNPIFLVFRSDHKYFYYVNKSSDEWIPLTNDNGNQIHGKLSDQELKKRMHYIISKTFKAFYLDITNKEDYDSAGEKVSVIQENPTSDDLYTHSKYKHYVDKGVFILGGCFENRIFMHSIPIGLNVESMTVHYNYSLSFMIILAVVENGKKRDIYVRRNENLLWSIGKKPVNTPEESTPGYFKPSYTRPSDFKPQDSKPRDSKPRDSKPQDSKPGDSKPRDSTPLFDESKNDIIQLDAAKKHDYECITNSASSKCTKILVKYSDKISLCTIYTQEPVLTNPSEKSKQSFMYTDITSNGNKLSGIVPGKISRMKVYFLDDIVPVGIEIITDATVYFINQGKNYWKQKDGSISMFLLELVKFTIYSRANNYVVAFDAGKKVVHVDRGEPPTLNRSDHGVYKEYAIQLSDMNKFVFHGLTYRGLWYQFDSHSLFCYNFVEMKVYYDPNDKIPLMFELSGQETFRFYNQFDGTWKPIFSISNNISPLLDLTLAKIAGAISIDNYRDYNNGSTDITVAATKFTDKYARLVHTPAKNVKFSGVLYRAYFIKPTFKVPDFTSLTVYFKAGTHLALMIQFHVNAEIYSCAYDMSDSWGFLEPPSDLLKTLDDIHSKFYPAGS